MKREDGVNTGKRRMVLGDIRFSLQENLYENPSLSKLILRLGCGRPDFSAEKILLVCKANLHPRTVEAEPHVSHILTHHTARAFY